MLRNTGPLPSAFVPFSYKYQHEIKLAKNVLGLVLLCVVLYVAYLTYTLNKSRKSGDPIVLPFKPSSEGNDEETNIEKKVKKILDENQIPDWVVFLFAILLFSVVVIPFVTWLFGKAVGVVEWIVEKMKDVGRDMVSTDTIKKFQIGEDYYQWNDKNIQEILEKPGVATTTKELPQKSRAALEKLLRAVKIVSVYEHQEEFRDETIRALEYYIAKSKADELKEKAEKAAALKRKIQDEKKKQSEKEKQMMKRLEKKARKYFANIEKIMDESGTNLSDDKKKKISQLLEQIEKIRDEYYARFSRVIASTSENELIELLEKKQIVPEKSLRELTRLKEYAGQMNTKKASQIWKKCDHVFDNMDTNSKHWSEALGIQLKIEEARDAQEDHN